MSLEQDLDTTKEKLEAIPLYKYYKMINIVAIIVRIVSYTFIGFDINTPNTMVSGAILILVTAGYTLQSVREFCAITITRMLEFDEGVRRARETFLNFVQ